MQPHNPAQQKNLGALHAERTSSPIEDESCASCHARSRSAAADLSGRPCPRHCYRAVGSVVEGMAPREQLQHVLCAVSRPKGQLSMTFQIKWAAPVDGFEANVDHGTSCSQQRSG